MSYLSFDIPEKFDSFRCGLVKITTTDLTLEILQRVERIENTLSQGLKQVEMQLANGQVVFQLFNNGLTAYKDSLLKENQNKKLHNWFEKIRADSELRFPHRKILDFLLRQYDFAKNEFNEVHFSRLVKDVHLGKNMANDYFSFLERKGYIQIRDDGYRKFFKIHE